METGKCKINTPTPAAGEKAAERENVKVKNVIKGHTSKATIERLTIIDTTELNALFAGHLTTYNSASKYMKTFKDRVDNMDVIKSQIGCGGQLFIYVK